MNIVKTYRVPELFGLCSRTDVFHSLRLSPFHPNGMPSESTLASASPDSPDEGIRDGEQSFLETEPEYAEQPEELKVSLISFGRLLFPSPSSSSDLQTPVVSLNWLPPLLGLLAANTVTTGFLHVQDQDDTLLAMQQAILWFSFSFLVSGRKVVDF